MTRSNYRFVKISAFKNNDYFISEYIIQDLSMAEPMFHKGKTGRIWRGKTLNRYQRNTATRPWQGQVHLATNEIIGTNPEEVENTQDQSWGACQSISLTHQQVMGSSSPSAEPPMLLKTGQPFVQQHASTDMLEKPNRQPLQFEDLAGLSDQNNVCESNDECSSDDEGECDFPGHVDDNILEQDNLKNQLSYKNTAPQEVNLVNQGSQAQYEPIYQTNEERSSYDEGESDDFTLEKKLNQMMCHITALQTQSYQINTRLFKLETENHTQKEKWYQLEQGQYPIKAEPFRNRDGNTYNITTEYCNMHTGDMGKPFLSIAGQQSQIHENGATP